MQYKITKEQFEALGETLQNEYQETDGVYILKIEGEDVPSPEKISELEKKREIEAEHRKAAEKKLKEADDRAAKLQADLGSAQGDSEKIEEIRKDYQEQLDRLKEERRLEQEAFKNREKQEEIRKVAREISQSFTVPDIMVDVIAKSLGAREVDGKIVVHPLDESGKESLETIADFKKRQLDKPEWKHIVKGDAGSGGGASGSGGGATQDKKWSQMTGTEQVMLRKENPERASLLMRAEGFSTD